MKTPILFIVFNRRETTEKVFAAIRQARPDRLFIAADAPRQDHPGEEEKCAQTRKIMEKVDWPCDLKTKFSGTNLGSRRGPSSAIDWFFENVEEGIILEHDCLPHQSFFQFCEALLERYRDNDQIMHISGNNHLFGRVTTPHDYYFSRIPLIWGWATWRRAWKNYDVNIKDWPDRNVSIPGNFIARRCWTRIFNLMYNGKIETWDYQWTYALFKNNGLAINPAKNLVSNIGFGEGATFGKNSSSIFANMKAEQLTIANHPLVVSVDQVADNYVLKHHFHMTWYWYCRRICKSVLKRLNEWS